MARIETSEVYASQALCHPAIQIAADDDIQISNFFVTTVTDAFTAASQDYPGLLEQEIKLVLKKDEQGIWARFVLKGAAYPPLSLEQHGRELHETVEELYEDLLMRVNQLEHLRHI